MQVRRNHFPLTLPGHIVLFSNNSVETVHVYLLLPELYVVARVELHCSEYQGMFPFSLALLTDKVYIEVA